MTKHLLAVLALALPVPVAAQAQPEPVDALTTEIQLADADRFAAMFEQTGGTPSAEEVQRLYLDPGSYGVAVFTPYRITSAENLAAAIAADPASYRKAIDVCLPQVRAANGDLRSIYLGLQGALPDAKLPQVYVLFGAGNSGGTADLGAQVLGLEVLCGLAEDHGGLRRWLRHFFAHETIHAMQQEAGAHADDDALLRNVLAEGAADFIARLVTGQEPDEAKAEFGMARETELFARFLADIDIVRDHGENDAGDHTNALQAERRWVGNYGSAPDGWPGELGYWLGLRIWEANWNAAEDKRAVLQRMLTLEDPRGVLATWAGRSD